MPKYVVVVVFSLTLFTSQANSQFQRNPADMQLQKAAEREAANDSLPSNPQQQMEKDQIARAMVQQRAQLRLDTEKLLSLTAELKQQVEKTNANILSMDVIKKAQEIQKLAKSVQDKMKNAY
jgi:hypothetical protein